MKRVILGTAGHIDHGKTALVRALSGVDTDRLQEEKRRGITIELGFAHLELKDLLVGIVDVPGHERFVRAMASGATGIDMVMLVVAADEGVMPQTREHLDICTLLGIDEGFVALTKVDLVDGEWLDLVREDLRQELLGSFLEGAPLVETSAQTGEGLDAVQQVVGECGRRVPGKDPSGLARLPVDRVFAMQGFGAVVTGTLHAGRLREGDRVELLPGQTRARIRGLQVHNQRAEEIFAGQRAAVNLQGVELLQIERGQILCHEERLAPTKEVDSRLRLLPHVPAPLKHRAPLLLHTGTTQISCRVLLHERDVLAPGEEAFARLLLERPTVLLPGDRFILRGFQRIPSNGTTVGGGAILDPVPPRRRRKDPLLVQRLETLAQAELTETISLLVREGNTKGIDEPQLSWRVRATPPLLQKSLALLLSQQQIVRFDKEPNRYVHSETLEESAAQLLELLGAYHEKNPLREGIAREELRERSGLEHPRLFALLLERMSREEQIVQQGELIRLSEHRVVLQQDQAKLEEQLLDLYLEGRFTPPRARDLPQLLKLEGESIPSILALLERRSLLVRVRDDLYFHRQNLDDLQERLIAFLRQHEEITPQQFKEMTGASRKFSIPLAEYLDAQKITMRVGEVRRLRARWREES